MKVEQRLTKDINQFLRFIDAAETINTIQANLLQFFEKSTGPAHVVHDRGDIYYYRGDRLVGFDSVGNTDSIGLIHTFDGRKTMIISPYSDDRSYQMKSGGSGRGTGRRGASSGTSTNNNNNNNNNNNG